MHKRHKKDLGHVKDYFSLSSFVPSVSEGLCLLWLS